MGLHILIVDDEALARARLRTLLAECTAPGADSVTEAGNAAEAMERLQHGSANMLLLDIHMPGMDGIGLAQLLGGQAQPPAIVFVTAHAEHAVAAFELEAVDYLTKPVRLERLQHALQKAERFVQAGQAKAPHSAPDSLLIQDRGRTERIPLADVLYFKAELKYTTVRTRTRSYILNDSLSELEARHGHRFMRIHRNALVARQALRALGRHHDPDEGEVWAVQLDGLTEPLMVSRRQVTAVREAIAGRPPSA